MDSVGAVSLTESLRASRTRARLGALTSLVGSRNTEWGRAKADGAWKLSTRAAPACHQGAGIENQGMVGSMPGSKHVWNGDWGWVMSQWEGRPTSGKVAVAQDASVRAIRVFPHNGCKRSRGRRREARLVSNRAALESSQSACARLGLANRRHAHDGSLSGACVAENVVSIPDLLAA